MLKFGYVSKLDAAKGYVRVQFDDDEIVSGPLPVLQPKTLKDRHYYVPDINEHVVCLMDDRCENGVVLGAIYSDVDAPGFASENITGVLYESGDEISYNRETRKLTVKTDTTQVTAMPAGPAIKKGGESLKTILSDLIDQILAETHPTGVGPSGPPLNSAAYTSIKTRINNFFES